MAGEAAGAKHEACKTATPIDLKIKYSVGYDDKPLSYYYRNRDYLIDIKIKAKVTIDLISTDKWRHNLELLTAKDPEQFLQKLNNIYTPPFLVLTQKPEMEFNKNNVTLSFFYSTVEIPPDIYTVHVSPVAPRHLTGSLKPKTVTGTFGSGRGCKFKYTVDWEFTVDVVEKQGFKSLLGEHLTGVGKMVIDDFSDERNQKEIAKGLGATAKVVVLTKTAVAIKTYAIFDVATGGPVTTSLASLATKAYTKVLVAAGTPTGHPTGQKVLMEFIPSMNPGTLPDLSSLYGVLGWAAGATIEEITKNR